MSFYKRCICGEKINSEKRSVFPDNCPVCGRKLFNIQAHSEDEAYADVLINNMDNLNGYMEDDTIIEEPKSENTYYLELPNGKKIEIPDEGGIIGRTGIGAEELAEFQSVSRQHLKVLVKKNIGVLVEDLSSYGTFVDGKRIEKNKHILVHAASKITLCDIEMVLSIKENGK